MDKYKYLDIDESMVEELKEYIGYPTPRMKESGDIADNPLAALQLCLEFGHVPPATVLLEIANTYAKYMDAEGAMSLEEAFFGQLTKGVGNYSARRAKSEELRLLDLELSIEEAFSEKGERRSQIEIVEEYLERQGRHDEDPEHVLRRIRRFRSKS